MKFPLFFSIIILIFITTISLRADTYISSGSIAWTHNSYPGSYHDDDMTNIHAQGVLNPFHGSSSNAVAYANQAYATYNDMGNSLYSIYVPWECHSGKVMNRTAYDDRFYAGTNTIRQTYWSVTNSVICQDPPECTKTQDLLDQGYIFLVPQTECSEGSVPIEILSQVGVDKQYLGSGCSCPDDSLKSYVMVLENPGYNSDPIGCSDSDPNAYYYSPSAQCLCNEGYFKSEITGKCETPNDYCVAKLPNSYAVIFNNEVYCECKSGFNLTGIGLTKNCTPVPDIQCNEDEKQNIFYKLNEECENQCETLLNLSIDSDTCEYTYNCTNTGGCSSSSSSSSTPYHEDPEVDCYYNHYNMHWDGTECICNDGYVLDPDVPTKCNLQKYIDFEQNDSNVTAESVTSSDSSTGTVTTTINFKGMATESKQQGIIDELSQLSKKHDIEEDPFSTIKEDLDPDFDGISDQITGEYDSFILDDPLGIKSSQTLIIEPYGFSMLGQYYIIFDQSYLDLVPRDFICSVFMLSAALGGLFVFFRTI